MSIDESKPRPQTGADPQRCADVLREALARGNKVTDGKGMSLKLHQFISQGQTLYATLESAAERAFSFDDQMQTADGKLLVSVKFCRQCGQDYCHVARTDARFVPLATRELPEEDGLMLGYLMPAPAVSESAPR